MASLADRILDFGALPFTRARDSVLALAATVGDMGIVAGRISARMARLDFDRRELMRILELYGRKVAAGEWRDYAIDFLKDRAVFSVFRRSSEVPLYRIEKDPRLARKQGAYSVISATGLIVKRGHELDNVLRAVDKSLKLVAV